MTKSFWSGLDLFIVFFSFVPHVEPFLQSVFSKGAPQTKLLLNLPEGHCVWNQFHQAWQRVLVNMNWQTKRLKTRDIFICIEKLTLSSASRKTPVCDHSQVQTLLQPNSVHHTDDLEHQHVLPQVISCLNNALTERRKLFPKKVALSPSLGVMSQVSCLCKVLYMLSSIFLSNHSLFLSLYPSAFITWCWQPDISYFLLLKKITKCSSHVTTETERSLIGNEPFLQTESSFIWQLSGSLLSLRWSWTHF